ncbi:IPT/TIG domain-containing protein [Opitutus sp. ER46]|uniref:IPT/TIG domain-containing protein n=1 Tax=Opitutus sp. ER46 TaxID=2161864 RepID=UPI000D2FA930|nr:IPT/TIG domain-containing protein [Opitutus sp. ER46]PTX91123.1 cell surface protein [Opitutus sp. ER46]
MQTTRISPARKILFWLVAALGLGLLTGCETVTLTNLTPPAIDENPSQIYTFTLRVTPRTNTVLASSISPKIVIDRRNFALRKSALGENLWEFEYQLPPGVETIPYYFLVNYSVEGNATVTPQEAYTDLQRATIVRRKVVSLVANRGPVGARVSVLGRGFSASDVILVNGTPARTVFESPTSLSFFVPAIEPNRNYGVTLQSPLGNSPVGTFHVDAGSVSVFPMSLNLRSGQREQLTFTLPMPAPAGGTLLDVTTDIPDSVIMPEVIVPEGQASVSITVEGGKPGNGTLYLKGFGAGEVTVPVTVSR